MKSRCFPSLMIVLLAWTSLPAWSVRSQAGHAATLACVHACALGEALMTHGGRLPALGEGQCLVRSPAAAATLQVDAAKISPLAASAELAPSLAGAASALPSVAGLGHPRRGPPAYGGFLWSQHPSAQAPPTL